MPGVRGQESRLVYSQGAATYTAVGTVADEPIVAVGINLATARDQSSAANVIVDVAIVQGHDATAAPIDAIRAVVVYRRVAYSDDSRGPIRQGAITGVPGEVALVGRHARVDLGVEAITVADH